MDLSQPALNAQDPDHRKISKSSTAIAEPTFGSESDHDVLDEILSIAYFGERRIGVVDCLLKRFGSLRNILESSRDSDLAREMPLAAVQVFVMLQKVIRSVTRVQIDDRPIISNLPELRDYLHLTLVGNRTETISTLYLDSQGHLIFDEIHSKGRVSCATVYAREVSTRGLEVNASNVFIAHNHPCGDPMPTSEDIIMSQNLKTSLEWFDIHLSDSVIISNTGFTSLKELGFI